MRTQRSKCYPAVLLTVLTAACIDTAAPKLEFPDQVAAITVQPAEATTSVGKLLPLSALAFDPSGNKLENQDIIWTSTDTSVATVSEKGEVAARRVGSTLITASNGIKTGTATLTVLAPQVASVALSPASASLLAGDTALFSAQPRDDEAQPIGGRSVKWSVANPAIATVVGGVLVGLSAGSTVVVASVDGVRDSAFVQVSARPVASVSIVPGTVTLVSGKTTKLNTTVLDDRGKVIDDKIVSWSSGDEEVATISADGTVSALSSGTVTITATATSKGGSGKGKVGKGQVKVTTGKIPVASVSVAPSTDTLITSATLQLIATPKDSDGNALGGRTVSWTTSNSSVATVSSSGVVRGVAPGKSTITATVEGAAGAATVTVTLPPVASVSVSPSSAQLEVGKSVTLTATTVDATGGTLSGRTVTWSSGKSSVATVSSSGVVTGAAAGSAWIFATSEGKRDSAAIVVSLPAVASISISPSSASLVAGDTKALTATVKDASGAVLTGRTIAWISSDQSVATVSSAGLVTAVGAGTATVTAASEGKSATAGITVTIPEPPATSDPAPGDGSDGSDSSSGGSSGGSGGGTDSGPHSGYFVSPSGSSGASGSESSPMSLSAALSGGNGKIQPGDTVWLRQGTYSGNFNSTLSGSSSAPIIVRQYPGERATINGTMNVDGRYTWYWGFEVANTSTSTIDIMGINSHCPGCRFINLVIHDQTGNGLGMWSEGPDQVAYGNILYNNGFRAASGGGGYGHGIYAQNSSGSKQIANNVLFNQFGYGIHVYGSSESGLNNFTIDGNAVANSGQGDGMDYQVGGGAKLVNLTFTNNMSYRSSGRRDNTIRMGYSWGPVNSGAVMTNNYFVGRVLMSRWSSLTFQGNSIIGPSGPALTLELADGQSMTTGSWNGNSYMGTSDPVFSIYKNGGGEGYSLSSWRSMTGFDGSSSNSSAMPSQTKVVVEPNRYEAGRANVIIYNWGRQGAVSVDLSKVLRSGDRYEVRNAQNFYGAPVASGTYNGGSVSVPITSVTPPRSIGGQSTSSTGTEFNAYVVVKK